jgi:hypothetical protein
MVTDKIKALLLAPIIAMTTGRYDTRANEPPPARCLQESA